MIGVRIQCNDRDIREIVNSLSLFSANFSDYLYRVVDRFAGKFRQNVYSAVVRNVSWATANWPSLSPGYVRRKGNSRFYYKTGLLSRSIRANARVLRRRGQGQGDFTQDMMEGLILERIYPNSKKGLSTHDVFMINEYGTKNGRPPSRPVIMPAFWRTLQMFDMEEEFIKEVRTEIPEMFE